VQVRRRLFAPLSIVKARFLRGQAVERRRFFLTIAAQSFRVEADGEPIRIAEKKP
jgi:hypothetical protein